MNEDNIYEQKVARLRQQIEQYVAKVTDLIIPSHGISEIESVEKEEEKLKGILFNAVAIDVYYDYIEKLYDTIERQKATNERPRDVEQSAEFSPIYEVPFIKLALEKTKPNRTVPLKTFSSRYLKGVYHNTEKKYDPVTRSIREQFLTGYAKKCLSKMSTKQFLKAETETPGLEAIFTFRDFFHNGGNLNMVNFNNILYKDLEEAVKFLEKEVVSAIEDYDFMQKYEYTKNPISVYRRGEISKNYNIGREGLRRFSGICLFEVKTNSIRMSKYNGKETSEDEKYRVVSEMIVDLFDKEFCELPLDESTHLEKIEEIAAKITGTIDGVVKTGKASSQNAKAFCEEDEITSSNHNGQILGLYTRYMRQLEEGTLPLRKSYVPVDKKMYEKTVRENIEAQDYLREHGNSLSPTEGTLAAALGVLATIIGTSKAYEGDPTILISTVATGVGVAIARKIKEYKELRADPTRTDISRRDLGVSPYDPNNPDSVRRRRVAKYYKRTKKYDNEGQPGGRG